MYRRAHLSGGISQIQATPPTSQHLRLVSAPAKYSTSRPRKSAASKYFKGGRKEPGAVSNLRRRRWCGAQENHLSDLDPLPIRRYLRELGEIVTARCHVRWVAAGACVCGGENLSGGRFRGNAPIARDLPRKRPSGFQSHVALLDLLGGGEEEA